MTSQRKYFIHLLAAALNGTKPDEKPEDVSFEKIYNEAARQHLLSAVYSSIKQLNSKPDKELLDKWDKAFLRELIRCESMKYEATELSCALADLNIPIMLLKGCVIQPLYPEAVYRSMSDIDLLYFSDDTEFKEAMTKLGYTLKLNGECHDSYLKGNYTIIEAHKMLFPEGNIYGTLFKDIKNRAVSDKDRHGLLYMTNEDAYIFSICHSAKHYTESGIGLRILLDIYVIHKAYGKALDYKYIDEKLTSVGLLRFKNMLEQISFAWLGGGEAELPQAVEDEFFLGTVYGMRNTIPLRTAAATERKAYKAKLSYILSSVFTPKSRLKKEYPVLVKHPLLLPACMLHRWIKKIFSGSVGRVSEKASYINDTYLDNQIKAFEYFGIIK